MVIGNPFAQYFLDQRAYRVAPALKRDKGRIVWGTVTAIAAVIVITLAEIIAHCQDLGLPVSEHHQQWWTPLRQLGSPQR